MHQPRWRDYSSLFLWKKGSGKGAVAYSPDEILNNCSISGILFMPTGFQARKVSLADTGKRLLVFMYVKGVAGLMPSVFAGIGSTLTAPE